MSHPLRLLLLFLVCAPLLAGAETADAAAAARAAAARTAMERATRFMRSLAVEGGYVFKYTPDLKKRAGERPASPTQISIEPPGTPSVGLAFLRAHAVTGDALYLDAARDVARALGRCQLGSGGWNRLADFDPAHPNLDGKLHHKGTLLHGQIIQHTLRTTFDDDTTQSAVRFLIAFCKTTRGSADARDTPAVASLDRALQGMIRAQYPTGSWPQRYEGKPRRPEDHPVRRARIPTDYPRKWPDADYTRFYTLNDNCQSDCIETMLLAYRETGRKEYLDSARRGADFLLLAQLPEPQPGWAQQYNFAMDPAWARVMEPPAVSSAESGRVIKALIVLYLETGARKYFDAAGPAIAWLNRSKVGGNQWSRLYELGTNRPIYGDERGEIVYDKTTLSEKFAVGYTWQSTFHIPPILALYERVQREGRDAVRASTVPEDLNELAARVDQALAALDAAGRWIVSDWWQKRMPPEPLIETKAYIANMAALSDYVERVQLIAATTK